MDISNLRMLRHRQRQEPAAGIRKFQMMERLISRLLVVLLLALILKSMTY
jgi:hypothetical protein